MQNHEFVVEAAGGNATAIVVLPSSLTPDRYAELGAELMKRTESLGVEQAGFLIPTEDRFDMSGGEFCGNAARAAAMLLSRIKGSNQVVFTMSGYSGSVQGNVSWNGDAVADVVVHFDHLPATAEDVTVLGTTQAQVVDLGGIVHVLVRGPLPDDYEAQHRAITVELGLNQRGAVGVVWYDVSEGEVLIHPVVWVRAIDSFFYESACGSGSIAAEVVAGKSRVVQPSGLCINVNRRGDEVDLASTMEITHDRAE